MFPRLIVRGIPTLRLTKVLAATAKHVTTSPHSKFRVGYTPYYTPFCTASLRLYSVKSNPEEMSVNYDYVKKATTDNKILIVDVREPDEIKEHGKIPSSINIPLGDVTSVLSTMPDKDFEQTYKRPKPADDTQIIFYCMIGKRSGMAQQNALNIGYKNVKNYLGSWNDWATKSQS